MRIYIDRNSHLPVKSQARLSNESILHEEVYANWHEFDGVMTPLMLIRYKDGAKTTFAMPGSCRSGPPLARG